MVGCPCRVSAFRVRITTTITRIRMSAPIYAENVLISADLASWQKINSDSKGFGNESEGDLISKGE